MKYRCNKHKSNDGFYDLSGKWFCWYCYEEEGIIKIGDHIKILIPFMIHGVEFRDKVFKVFNVFDNGSIRIRFDGRGFDFSSSVVEKLRDKNSKFNL